jgi:CheY-like chemotaxis protein
VRAGRDIDGPVHDGGADLLVVDDDPDIAELLADQLESEGHVVRVAHDGREGFRLITERPPDLVLLDVEMPFVTGPQMSQQMLLHDLGLEEIPIVLMSGVVGLTKVAECVGTPYFLAKPFGAEALSQLVAWALAERRPPAPAPTQEAR